MSYEVFSALADPNRRHIFELLNRRGPATATSLVSELDITRQAVAKHLALLTSAGLTTAAKVGRETRFAPRPEALAEVRHWVAQVEGDWVARLDLLADSLAEHVEPE